MNTLRKYKNCILLFILLQGAAIGILTYFKELRMQNYLEQQIHLIDVQYHTIYNMYKKMWKHRICIGII